MAQPIRKSDKKPKKTVKARKAKVSEGVDNRLPSKKNVKGKKKWNLFRSNNKNHPEYGTSKLELRFQRDFLDKIGVKYIYQFKMGLIGRYLDFMVVDDLEHPSFMVAIELDGTYYHSYGLTYEQMNPMQKKNHRVDKIKDEWCARNGIPLIRIWEHDINEKPTKVLNWLREVLRPFIDGTYENKRKRHN